MCYRNSRPESVVYLLGNGIGVFGRNINKQDRVVQVVGPIRCFNCQTGFTRRGCLAGTSTFRTSAMYLVPVAVIASLLVKGTGLTVFFVHRLSLSLKVTSRHAIGLARGRVQNHLTRSLLFLGSDCNLRRSKTALDVCLSQRSLTGLSGVAASGTVHALSAFMTRHVVTVSNQGVGLVSRSGLGGVDGVK